MYPMIISPALECIAGTDLLSNWQNLHSGTLTCGVRNVTVRWTHVEVRERPLPTKWQSSGGGNMDAGINAAERVCGDPNWKEEHLS